MKPRPSPLALLLAGALVASLAACSSSGVSNGVLSGQTQAVGGGISDLIELENERVTFGKNELPVYQVEVVNDADRDLRLEYRSRWYDADGIEVRDVTRAWQPLFLPEDSSAPIRSVAPSLDAVRAVIEVRLHDPDTY